MVSTGGERDPLSTVPATVYLVGGFSTGKLYAVGLIVRQVELMSDVGSLAAGLLDYILTLMAGIARRHRLSAVPYRYHFSSRIICGMIASAL